MNDKDSYDCIRKLVMEGNIAAMTLDVLDGSRYGELARAIEGAGLEVSLIYLSNIPHFLHIDKSKEELAEGRAVDFYERSIMPTVAERLFTNQSMVCNAETKIICAERKPVLSTAKPGDIYELQIYDNQQLLKKFMGEKGMSM